MRISKGAGLGLILALLVSAFAALPAIASAAPQLTEPNGTTVPVGATVTGTSTNAKTVLTGVGTLECSKVVIHGIVTANTGSLVQVSMDGESDTAEGCKIGTTSVTVKPTLTSIELSASVKTASFDFAASGGITESSDATVTYTSGASSVHVAGPVTGTVPGTFSGDFALTNAAGKAIKVD